MDLDEYAFELPEEQIAQHPLKSRDASRLLRLDRSSGAISGEHRVHELPELLSPGDLLVVNATQVLSARLLGQKASGGRAEALLMGADPSGQPRTYRALIRSGGRLRVGLKFTFTHEEASLEAELIALHTDGEATLLFAGAQDPLSMGEAPLPPYIQKARPTENGPEQRAEDLERYQTVYARAPGAIAAPTAGLHLTRPLLETLASADIGYAEVILHVGAGTFRPLSEESLRLGTLHSEHYQLPEDTAEAIERTRAKGGRVIAVGTTTTRVLEARATDAGGVRPGEGQTDLFIRPGDRFRVVDGLMTNFHLPRSSLLLLVAAFAGQAPVMAAYRHAVQSGYRFYSYGDAMLIV
ncbi:MAG: tRNA preQ1(34) S-adenosylmethionine ribosyltransferase-isomerase QueA [Deltaproteobacteria bacterium]|nr:tRNA preQ1(34) S-adenosylmethionine ribosyltransferase-isomerase QueA [Deltaproteobacteria bacterium]